MNLPAADRSPVIPIERPTVPIAHAEGGRFVSLFVAILDSAAGELTFVDAGHGYWMLKASDEPPRQIACAGGTPAGIRWMTM